MRYDFHVAHGAEVPHAAVYERATGAPVADFYGQGMGARAEAYAAALNGAGEGMFNAFDTGRQLALDLVRAWEGGDLAAAVRALAAWADRPAPIPDLRPIVGYQFARDGYSVAGDEDDPTAGDSYVLIAPADVETWRPLASALADRDLSLLPLREGDVDAPTFHPPVAWTASFEAHAPGTVIAAGDAFSTPEAARAAYPGLLLLGVHRHPGQDAVTVLCCLDGRDAP